MALKTALNRRDLIKFSGSTLAGLTVFGLDPTKLWAATKSPPPLVIIVFLRGAADGLSLVPPIGGPDRAIYEAERPVLAVPLSGAGAAFPLDARFGLHSAGKPFFDLYQAKKLAVVHSAGMTAASRSHFDAQAIMELGLAGQKTGEQGFFARWAHGVAAASGSAGAPQMVAMGNMLPAMLYGDEAAMSIRGSGAVKLGNEKDQALIRMALRSMYGGGDWLARRGSSALDAMDRLDVLAGKDPPAVAGDYGKNEFGDRIKSLAQLIKSPFEFCGATVDMGGWDTHKNQGATGEGKLAENFDQLTGALSALITDAAPRPLRIVVMTEFGRRLKENANRGTDHGHGSVMFVLGDGVKGGEVYGDWPGLATERLYERADLAVTTDYRQVLWESLSGLAPGLTVGQLFPGFKSGKSLGLMA